ncbi:MAG: hydroxylamine reductase [Omnitrophica bacterium RIFCSPLOWO2_12_FULL_44_17]|uniref:Hydroxylamine reductase n=1 Tax=Candidatus Danuiimicrobium aquiferis TaxID=1801832 RepID=A0A1G1KXA7_9BACT|nr:MAG: hydroxylamine reductase [Omnitrophica bacterium RIFCSPHIGHO2_02_FULL_45_28]OGW89162.1 MAG: hydroxylamine reductase [Omnitrophica bacterium RIFCSPHIGHO2_12_FULL_44_12]OGW97554.1 MAG: hydroxylamine reductase [Omnitrophica bacterium RIFCSPLOWO2_12_FULL_44_17]OGX02106.1 MAG: hydroxylamine reductase [Omnitrophica bacterium RIFCSPLOWO2_02_FULL_44_11]
MGMFCYQCEQTSKGTGCTFQQGVCGKTSETAVLQDLLIYALKGIAVYGKLARELGVKDRELDLFIIKGLFTTVTNVDFDSERIGTIIRRAYIAKEKAKELFASAYRKKHGKDFDGTLPIETSWKPAETFKGLIEQGESVGIMNDLTLNEDIRSLQQLLTYGLKGMAAYADHASILGKEDETVMSFFYKGLAAMTDSKLTVSDLVNLNMEFGKVNFRCMEILDQGHTERFGHPVPTQVFLGAKKGPAVLVSGHDLPDLEELLKQTEGKGINIYTHGEMLPAHGYPGLKKYKHLVGNYGGAWQDQAKEFDQFPGAILMTTNCIQKPKESYQGRIFTTGLVAWPNVVHIDLVNGRKDFSPVIQKAIQAGGFKSDLPGKEIMVGFGHNAVMSVAGQVIEAVKAGKIKHFFLVGGCDGAKSGRNYYTDFSQKVPKDCVILTLACGKYRFNKLEFGDIGGIPRLLDVGQCNDAYSAVQIALALANAFKCGVNELPLTLVLSWYEQKAVCILLTLLSLGIKNIRLGPSLPAFVSPNVLKVLVDQFNIKPISTPDSDLQAILGVAV